MSKLFESMKTRVLRRPSVSTLYAALLVAGCVYGFLFVVTSLPHAPIVGSDTKTYLEWLYHRGLMYPLFLSATSFLSSDFYPTAILQSIFGFISAAIFCTSLGRFFRMRGLSVVLAWTCVTQVAGIYYGLYLGPESLYSSFLLLHFASVFAYLTRRRAWLAVAIGLTAGLAMGMRPTGCVLLLDLLVLFWFRPGRTIRRALLIFGPWIAIAIAMLTFNLLAYGQPSLFVKKGSRVFSNNVHLLPKSPTGPYADLVNWITARTAHFQGKLDYAKSFFEHERVKDHQYEAAAYGRFELEGLHPLLAQTAEEHKEELRSYKASLSRWNGRYLDEITNDNLKNELGKMAIREDPAGFVNRAVSNWLGHWYSVHFAPRLDGRDFQGKRHAVIHMGTEEEVISALPENEIVHFLRNCYETEISLSGVTFKCRTAVSILEGGIVLCATVLVLLRLLLGILRRGKDMSPVFIGFACLVICTQAKFVLGGSVHPAYWRYTNVVELPVTATAVLSIVLLVRHVASSVRRDPGTLSCDPQPEQPTT